MSMEFMLNYRVLENMIDVTSIFLHGVITVRKYERRVVREELARLENKE